MINELVLLENLEKNPKKKDKEALLKTALADSKVKDLLNAVFNFKRKFFIRKFDVSAIAYTYHDKHDEFMLLLSVLESQKIRGDAAKSKVEKFLNSCTILQQKWYSRIIRKDLKAGFSISTANKAGFKIPRFEVMLAKDGKICKKLEEVVAKGGFLSRKLDGYRCLAEVNNGAVTLYSRNGTIYENFPSVEASLSKLFPVGKYVFDGEIMSNDFQSMQKAAFASKNKQVVGDETYHIFDFIPHSEWNILSFKIKKVDRIKLLKEAIISSLIKIPSNLKIVEQRWISSLDKIMELERKYIEEGYEGAMFLPNIPYYLGKKSNKMLKFKTMKSQDVEIMGCYKSTDEDGKYSNTLGGVNVKQEDGVLCDCGSGFSDADRDHIWANQDQFIGRIFEAKYQEIASNGKMRFPIFKRWREDKQ